MTTFIGVKISLQRGGRYYQGYVVYIVRKSKADDDEGINERTLDLVGNDQSCAEEALNLAG